uniref:ADF-H domain-containing protein n=1 Tax=Angiostrongylus cantonensis TaxID=6313 RepID=A0A0K0CXI8_ANGCA
MFSNENYFLIVKVDRDTQQIILDSSLEECSIEEIRKELSQQPRFVLISYVLRHADGRLSYPMCLVFYSPEGCSPELQMMYAGSKENVVQECEVTNVSNY